jgi:spore germination protein GerM
MTSRRHRPARPGRLLLGLIALAVTANACAIQPESAPNDLSEERTGVFGDPPSGDEAAGTNRIYLLAPATADDPQRLRSVLRDVPSSPRTLIESLFAGPNSEERDEQLDTAIPSGVELLGTRTAGQVVTVDVNDAFGDLTPDALRLAVAQIVATASESEGIEAVQLRIDGTTRVWPLGSGELTDGALTVYDYPGLIESTQPAFPAIPSPAA